MSEARRRRRRRETDENSLPEAVRAWFAGESVVPWEALLPGEVERVPTWWRAWRRGKGRGVKPPAGASWIDFAA
jgi:hypothetical protein